MFAADYWTITIIDPIYHVFRASFLQCVEEFMESFKLLSLTVCVSNHPYALFSSPTPAVDLRISLTDPSVRYLNNQHGFE